MYYFCTLFDRNYLYKGLALYNSLKKHCRDFKLFILCMDDIAYHLLAKMDLKEVNLVSLKEFEDPELLRIKNTRTAGEYCWTCTASLILFLLNRHPDLDMMTYLDADLFFYNNPQPLFDEFGNNSIFITEHNFSKEYQKLSSYGRYNVQFIIFRNDDYGLGALKWWRQKTINWCYSRSGGKDMQGGDQIYLNDWPKRFKGVHVLENKKFCLAPWNATKYQVFLKNSEVYVENTRLIFYHFHSFEINGPDKFSLAGAGYKIDKPVRDLVYRPYIQEIKLAIRQAIKLDSSFKYGFIKRGVTKKIKGLIKNLIYSLYRLRA